MPESAVERLCSQHGWTRDEKGDILWRRFTFRNRADAIMFLSFTGYYISAELFTLTLRDRHVIVALKYGRGKSYEKLAEGVALLSTEIDHLSGLELQARASSTEASGLTPP